MAATMGGEDRVMATAQRIVKSLKAPKDVTEDMIMILSSFDDRLSNIVHLIGKNSGVIESGVNNRLKDAERIIFRWDLDSFGRSLPWEENRDEVDEYLSAVDDIITLREELADQSDDDEDVLVRVENARESAMLRLEMEFRKVMTRNAVILDADRLYGSICGGLVTLNEEEINEFEDFIEGEEKLSFSQVRGGSLVDGERLDLIVPNAVQELKEIADRMIRSGYVSECRQIYVDIRRHVIEECISNLGVEKLSIEEVQRIDWRSLDEKMKKWIQVFKIVVKVVLTGEKKLCEQIFRGFELMKDECFIDTTKGCVMQLLNFGEAVAIERRSSEKLFRILDMYDGLMDAYPALQALFTYKAGELVCSEAKGVLSGLGEAAIATYLEFEIAVKSEQSRNPVQNGEIHPLSRYVMNYLRLLVDYSETLNVLLENCSNVVQSEDGHEMLESKNMSVVAYRLFSLISLLESNLAEKARLYEDEALQFVFLMNNILYIIHKVKDSELRKLLGDQWIRKHRGQIRQYATKYLRASWSKALACLKDEGIGSSSVNVSRALKERFKSFNAYFEDIYRIQTAWKVPDPQLREELRISISEKVIPAYRSFVGRFRSHLESGKHARKYMKYTPEDIEAYVVDLFEGVRASCSAQHEKKKYINNANL